MSIIVDEYEPAVDVADYPFPNHKEVQIRRDKWVTDEYVISDFLGRGKFGEVKKCRHKEDGKEFAAKFLSVKRPADEASVENEVAIMKRLQHRRLLQLYDAFSFRGEMCLVLEIVLGGELFDRVIDDDFVLTEKSCVCIMRQVCEGVRYMHSRHILHLDLKPENILCLSKTGNRIKIIDFGLAREYDPKKDTRVLFGTPEFMAPEVVQYDAISGATDMWSVGVISYVLLTGLSPFMGDNDGETLINVTKVDYDFDYDEFVDISEEAKDVIEKLLLLDKNKRLTADDCLQHTWLKKPEKPPHELELSKQRLKHYVYRRKWQKAVYAIIALRRMERQSQNSNSRSQRDTNTLRRPLANNVTVNAALGQKGRGGEKPDRCVGCKNDASSRLPREKKNTSGAHKSNADGAADTIQNKDVAVAKDFRDRNKCDESASETKPTAERNTAPWARTIHKSTPLNPLSGARLQQKFSNKWTVGEAASVTDGDRKAEVSGGRTEPEGKKTLVLTTRPPRGDVTGPKEGADGLGGKANRRSWQKAQNDNKLAQVRVGWRESERQEQPAPPRDRAPPAADSIVKQMQKRLQSPNMLWSRVGGNARDGETTCETFKVSRQNVARAKDSLTAREQTTSGAPGAKSAPMCTSYVKDASAVTSAVTSAGDDAAGKPLGTLRRRGAPADAATAAHKDAAAATKEDGQSERSGHHAEGQSRLAAMNGDREATDTATDAKAAVMRSGPRGGLTRSHARDRHSNHNPSASFKRRMARASKDINAESDETYVRLENASDVLQQQRQQQRQERQQQQRQEETDNTSRADAVRAPSSGVAPQPNDRRVVNRIQATIKMLTSNKSEKTAKNPRQIAADDNHRNGPAWEDTQPNADIANIEFTIRDFKVRNTSLNNRKNFAVDANGNSRQALRGQSPS